VIGPAHQNPQGPCTTAAAESVLVAMFDEALAQGESFIDVTAHGLLKKVSGPVKNSQSVSVCRRLMRRMMIPGDYELSTSFRRSETSLLVRFRLPR
jgi:hypothetical protein